MSEAIAWLAEPPSDEELALLRADPLLFEQELDARPALARALERVLERRSGRTFFRSAHDHLYALELADLGRGLPSQATVYGFFERFEPRPPEHELDADLRGLSLWLAQATDELVASDLVRVFERAGWRAGWPAGSVLRSDEARFADMPAFPWAPRYLEVEGLRMAWVEAGDPAARETFLLLHGEPTFGFLYRHMIPILAARGRVVVPDLIGFGRSDKPLARGAYSYRAHARWLRRFVVGLDLRGVTLVCQDWGGLLGLRVLAQLPEHFRRVVAMNTFLPDGSEPPSEGFSTWRRFALAQPALDVAALMRRAIRRRDFTEAEAAAYAAPFPTAAHQTAALAFPALVPVRPDVLAAWENRETRRVLRGLELPALTIFGEHDAVTLPYEETLRSLFRRVGPRIRLPDAGHFLQEDSGSEVARSIVAWIDRS